jgi:hypothetical protein
MNPWKISLADDLPLNSPRQVLLIYGEFEEVDGRAAIQYAAAQEPKELWIVPSGYHDGNHRASRQEYRSRVTHYYDQYLLIP